MPRRLAAALGLTLMVAGCSATDPAMKRGIADLNEARGLEGNSRICRNFVTNCRMF